MTLLIIALLAGGTQNEALFSGSVPEKACTFNVTVHGSQPFYAGVRVNGKWIDDPSTEIPPRQELELVPDAPWPAQETYRYLSSKVDRKYEASAMRRDRLQKALKAQGYSLRETANGWRPVRDLDVKYAERLRKMLAASRQSVVVTPVQEAPPAPVQDAAAATTMRRRFFVGMLAIPIACLAAIAYIAKKLVFGGGDLQKA